MSSSNPCTPHSKRPSTLNTSFESATTTTSCGMPGCFTYANGEKHAPLLTAFEEFLSIMQNHKDNLIRGSVKIKRRIMEIRVRHSDLESGDADLAELLQVEHSYVEALEAHEDEVAHVKREGMYGDSDGEEEFNEVEEKVELAKSMEDVASNLLSLAEKVFDASKDQQVDAYYVFHLFLDEVVAKAKMEKAKPKGNVGQYELTGAEPYSLDEEAKFENAEEEQEEQGVEEGEKGVRS
ncbi:uncharacterized protein K444DRAFT_630084 [Hyaloscypha bicolor E]|uniref:Uncharacterized protein n=1 Tax=Hyaloscypha bicolor E TaxID=1095630 RepID=A0A2J6T9K3_9HELO|nr:uncharacterized protein K444DRAFT_630084 [Hyaloscypha bicolor E]PMD59689.1 hypothetical protein K444DRAFT_630084 [Hyaloscypha bicolor E]